MAVEALGERGAEAGRQVLGHHHRGRIGGHVFEHHAQRFSAAGGRADGDQTVGGTEAQGAARHGCRLHIERDLGRAGAVQCADLGFGGHLDLADDFFCITFQPACDVDLGLGHEVHCAQRQRLQGGVGAAFGQR